MLTEIKKERMELKKALIERDISQHQMAADLGMNVTTLNRYLNGWQNLRPEDVKRIFEYLNMER